MSLALKEESASGDNNVTLSLVEVRYGQEVPAGFRLEGAEILKVGRYGVKLSFDSRRTPVEAVLAQLGQAGSLVDLNISDPSLEEVIRTIYQEQAASPAGGNGDEGMA